MKKITSGILLFLIVSITAFCGEPATFYSPTGNPEVWTEQPAGYYTPAEWTALHPPPVPEPPTLDELRDAKLAAVDANTTRLSALYGFKFRGASFSLEPLARQNWSDIANSLNLMTSLLSQGQISQADFNANFPVWIETLAKEPYQLAGPGDVIAFWNAYLGAQRDPENPLASGRILRARIAAAQTVEELEAIADGRE